MAIGYQIAEATPEDALSITGDSFGARFVSFRNFDRFDDAIQQTDLGMVIWPGGTLAEKNPERFGFEYDGLYNSDATGGKPGLDEIMAYCVDNGLSLTVTLPTARYADDHDALRADLSDFLDDLYGGTYGDLPQQIYFEVGNEFYGVFDGATEAEQAAAYAEIVNVYAEVVLEKEAEYADQSDSVDWNVQIGREVAATDAMLDVLSDDAILMTDALVHHRFNVSIDSADKCVDDVAESLNLWEQETDALGIDRPDLSLSAFNTASLSRVEAAQDFLTTEAGEGLTIDDLDLDGRSNLEFEQHYQEMLDYRPYGLEQGENILQVFSEYQGLGTSSAGIYGWDLTHAGRLSYEDVNGNSHLFVAGDLQDMMAEALDGTKVTNWYESNDLVDHTDTGIYGFDSPDKLVVFLTAPQDFGGQNTVNVELAMQGFGDITEVWGESLTSEVPEDWNTMFDVPVVDGVDQSPEAETYAVGVRESFAPEQDGGNLNISFTQPGEIIRLTFARNDAAADEIATWHGEQSSIIDLEAIAEEETDVTYWEEPEVLPSVDFEDDPDSQDNADEEEADAAHGGGGEGGGGGAGFAGLLGLMLMLMGV